MDQVTKELIMSKTQFYADRLKEYQDTLALYKLKIGRLNDDIASTQEYIEDLQSLLY